MAPILRETPLAVWMGTIRNTLIFSTLSAPSSCSVFLNDGWLVGEGWGKVVKYCLVLSNNFQRLLVSRGAIVYQNTTLQLRKTCVFVRKGSKLRSMSKFWHVIRRRLSLQIEESSVSPTMSEVNWWCLAPLWLAGEDVGAFRWSVSSPFLTTSLEVTMGFRNPALVANNAPQL